MSPGRLGLLGLGLLGGLLGGVCASVAGCGTAQHKTRDERHCGPNRPCDEGEVCIPARIFSKRGLCVTACLKDKDCGRGRRCSGRYQKVGTVERFCRDQTVGEGATCTQASHGCKAGLHCFRGHCVRGCKKDDECEKKSDRCLPVVVDTVVEKDRETVFHACLPVTRRVGESCGNSGPFCQRGLFCHDGKCVATCRKDKQCGRGRICDGALFLGPDGANRAQAKAKPDLRYCRKAARRNRPCHANLDVGCRRGLHCIKFRCRRVRHVRVGAACDPERGIFCKGRSVCFDTRCHRQCLEDKDCPRIERRRRARCRPKVVHQQPVRICL